MTSSQKKKLPHTVINVLSYLIFAGGLVRFIISYGKLDFRIGVHFSMYGFFDLYYNKVMGFFPFGLSILVMIFCGVFGRIIRKVRISDKTTIRGDALIRIGLTAFLDISQLVMVSFYSLYWSHCVIVQQPMPSWTRPSVLAVMLGLIVTTGIYLAVIYSTCRNKW